MVSRVAVKRKRAAGFEPKAFLTKASTGRSVSVYRKKQVVFAQGDPADAVFYLERGQIKLTGLGAAVGSWPCSSWDFFGGGSRGPAVRWPRVGGDRV